ncbi:MAG: hypothetical protein U0905_00995 [Pirellulales bacterium]
MNHEKSPPTTSGIKQAFRIIDRASTAKNVFDVGAKNQPIMVSPVRTWMAPWLWAVVPFAITGLFPRVGEPNVFPYKITLEAAMSGRARYGNCKSRLLSTSDQHLARRLKN